MNAREMKAGKDESLRIIVLKVEWGTHSEAPPEILNDLKNEVLAAAIDHINDHRYRTLAEVQVEAEVDIFTTGISVDPTFERG